MTLAQRLVQNDKEKDDLLVLKSIKYLYENGILDEQQASASNVDHFSNDTDRSIIRNGDRKDEWVIDTETLNVYDGSFADSEV